MTLVPNSGRIHALAPSEINGSSALLISELETMPSKPVLSQSFNASNGVRQLLVIWTSKHRNSELMFAICRENLQSINNRIRTSRIASFNFLPFLPLLAGSVVIGSRSTAAEAFLFGGISGEFSVLGHPAKVSFPQWVISRPKMGR